MTPSTLCPLTFGCCVNDEHLEGLLTSDLPLFATLMEGEKRAWERKTEAENQFFSYKVNYRLSECICQQ